MKMNIAAAATGCLLSTAATVSWADTAVENTEVVVNIAGHDVPVQAGGLYDRFRSNPPLSVIASEAPDVDLSWFKGIRKEKVDIGFPSYSPNFYYKNRKITAVFTADLARLKELMPEDIRQQVPPLQALGAASEGRNSQQRASNENAACQVLFYPLPSRYKLM